MWLSLLGQTKSVHNGSKIRPVFRFITDLLCWITRASRTILLLAFSLMPLMYGRNTKQITSNLTLHPSPFCPIVSSIDTLTYRLAKHLASICTTISSRNHKLLCQRLQGLCHKVGSNWCRNKDMMVITDIVSLFTRIPVSEAFWVIEDLLADDDTLKTQTNLLPANIVSLIRLCLTTTHFQSGVDFN